MNWLKKSGFILILLLVIVIIAYGQTLAMYFLIDDNALIYKLQHPDQTLGLWGKGLLGEGPYRHRVIQFVPFYPVFGVNPTPYFAVGVMLYYLASATVYYFTSVISKSRVIGFSTACIFAAGFIGSETMFGITNSWETSRGIIMALVTFLIYYHFLKTKKILFYLLSIVLFLFSLDTIYVRAHGLIFVLIAFDLIFSWKGFKLKELAKSAVRLLPFVIIYYQIYLVNTGSEVKRFGIWEILKSALTDGKLVPLTIPLQDIGNLFIPDILTSRLDKLISNFTIVPTELSVGSFLAGIFIIGLIIFVTLKFARKEKYLVSLLAFSVLWAISNFILFYSREPQSTLWTTHRYFSYSLVGVAIFWSICFYLVSRLSRKVFFALFTSVLVVLYLWFNVNAQYQFNQTRSLPARKLFADFTRSVPVIPKDAVLYFDLANDNQIKGKFGSFFGGMFSEASNFAIYTPGIDYMKDFIFTYKFEDVRQLLKEGKTTLDKVYTFYYGEDGLVDTTVDIREILQKEEIVNFTPDKFNFNAPSDFTFSPSPNTSSLVPSKLSFQVKVSPQIPDFPYGSDDKQNITQETKNLIFNYLIVQNNFRKTSVATSSSYWKEQEPKLALDGRLETAWRGHRGFWDEYSRARSKEQENFMVDMGKILRVSKIRWISAQKPLIPINYRILTSLDGKNWQEVLQVTRNKSLAEGTIIEDSFSSINARWVRMEINQTYGNDGPEIKEFEVIEEQFVDLNRHDIERVRQEPFNNIENLDQYQKALSFIRQNAVMRLYYQSSADNKQDKTRYVEVPILLDGAWHEYIISLPATGITWTNFTMSGFNFPAIVFVKNAKITYELDKF